MMRWIKPDRLKLDPNLAGLFPVREADLTAVTESMRERGYDQAEPLVVWRSVDILVDGHTRLRAAQDAGVERVCIDERPFEDLKDALEYAIRRQRDRRNLTPEELSGFQFRALAALERVTRQGQRTDLPSREGKSAEPRPEDRHTRTSAAEAAAQVGVSRATAERAYAVLASDQDEVKDQLRAGETTVNGAYRAVKQAEAARKDSAPASAPIALTVLQAQPVIDNTAPPEFLATYSVEAWEALSVEEHAAIVEFAPHSELGQRATLNEVNENIDWAGWSWNPVTGCLHNCAYCYARDIAIRHYAQKFEPTFIPSRLHAPRHTKLPPRATDPTATPLQRLRARNVFVCSMADLFGNWVPQDWIDAVFEQIIANPQWNFLCLTKFPQRLAELEWPANAWCGTSVDRQYRVEIAERSFRNVTAGVKWLSCEPMLERLTFTSLEMFDWVVIGASSKSSQTPEFQPPYEWIQHLKDQADAAGCKVYEKPNLKNVRRQEYPEGAMR